MAEPVDLGDKNSVTGAIETIKTRSTVKELVKDLRESLPNIYSALVDERDEYMTQSLLSRLSELPRSEPCLLYTSPSPRDQRGSRMPSSA